MTAQRPGLLVITPALKDYDWGDAEYIPRVLGLTATGAPVAEAWYGAHPQGPSAIDGCEESLLDRLAAEPAAWLGDALAARGEGLPFLVKFLAAARPLSIQVHPDAAQARAGFEREDAAGVPRDAPWRCYRDPRAKPELILALGSFEALCGFRADDELRAALRRQPELEDLSALCGRGWNGQRALLERWFELADEDVRARQGALVGRLSTASLLTDAERLLLRVAEAADDDVIGDRGLLFTLLLEHVHLEPGQALFLRAGVPHAYLRGAGLEVMGASDNVLRAGLTNKHVAPEELARIVRFAAGGAWRVVPEVDAIGALRYPTAAREFELSRLDLAAVGGTARWRCEGPEILLALEAAGGTRLSVRVGDEQAVLGAGAACLVAHGADVGVSGAGGLARVRVP
ncbi:MAG: mannose-6-phosphate isomerase, class I [Pseudomonadales bacterium]|jgi:mannose-6-phosphate isomerase class I|nr:mannose-6-phosphate isomerase, class I [Pseudomonadales bacterium]